MAREDNLIPGAHRLTVDEQSKAGRNSGKARLRKKKGRELLQELMSLKETDEKILKELEDLGIAPADVTLEMVMHVKQLRKAGKGDTAAYAAVFKAAGYEKQEIDINATVTRPKVVFEDEDDAVQDKQ